MFVCVWHRFGNLIGTAQLKTIKKIKMKTTIKSTSNFFQNLKNFWFALQLLIVSVSLPVMSFVQVAHARDELNSKQEDKVINKSVKQNQPIVSQQKNTANLKYLG